MSRQDQEQPSTSSAGGEQPRTQAPRNLYLNFPQSYEKYYNRQHGERRPLQSGFVSSTKWTPFDGTWYKTQTVYAPSIHTTGPAQDSKITNSRRESDKHLVKELLNDFVQ